ncbi:hypothetical protein V8D89_009851 [Ganoderma adspersum]
MADPQETGTNFSVPVYVMIEKGSTGKNASDNQGNWIGGPVTVDQNTTWEGFLEDIATTAEDSDPQDLVVKSLKWADPTKKGKTVQWLPMTNEAGFSAFVSNGILAAHGTQTKFHVKMSPPVPHNKFKPGWMADEDVRGGSEPDEPPLKKKKKTSTKSKASTSNAPFTEFAPHVSELKKKYPVGSCTYHLGICCFYDKQRNLHFELDKESLVFWANVLYRRKNRDGVDLENPPISKDFFASEKANKIPPAHTQLGCTHGAGPSHPPGFTPPTSPTHPGPAIWGLIQPPYYPTMLYYSYPQPPSSMYPLPPPYGPMKYPPPPSSHLYFPQTSHAHHTSSAGPSHSYDYDHPGPSHPRLGPSS